MARQKRVLIIGSGGIAGFYGALLHRAGWLVDMVARSDYEVIRRHGLTVNALAGDWSFSPHTVVPTLAQADVADAVLVGVKVLDDTRLADLIRPVVAVGTHIILIANGLDVEASITADFPDHPLTSCVAYVGVNRTAPGVIEQVIPDLLLLGCVPNGVDAYSTQLARELTQAGATSARTNANIITERWKKSLWNASFNPLSVLANGADTGRLLATDGAENLVRAVMADILEVANAQGHALNENLIDQNIEFTRSRPPYLTSMGQDFIHNRAIELDAIVGRIVARADHHALAIPYLRTVYETLRIRITK